jgi:chemotaxis protein histidine kinase CheA
VNEPIMDLSEIIGLYKEDARRSVGAMRAALGRWEDVCRLGPAALELRKLAHQLRGSGRTYGFRDVTRLGKAMEHVMIRLQTKKIGPDERCRTLLTGYVDRLTKIFAS